ncbi:MAG: 50S ribosomal protein L29 [Myxococcota bacterium]
MGENQELNDEQLVHKMLQTERDLVAARFKHSMNQLENTATLRVMRREIARLQTEARRREKDQGLPKNQLLSLHAASFGGAEAAPSGEAAGEKGGFLSGIVDRLTTQD